MRANRCVVILALAMLVSFCASANILTNGDFSLGVDPGVGMNYLAGSSAITGWTILYWDVDYTGPWWQAAPGTSSLRTVDLAGWRPGGIEQTVPTIAGQAYVLSFYLAGNVDGGNPIKLLDVLALHDNTVFASSSYSFDTTGYSRTNMGWQLQTWQFVAAGDSTTIRFLDNDSQPFDGRAVWHPYGPVIGNVSLDEVEDPPEHAPEPFSFVMLGSGLVALGYACRRRFLR
jgi:choice-of-anchor C domain-containing protein